MTMETQGLDEFDVLLNDVLRTVANPEAPERVSDAGLGAGDVWDVESSGPRCSVCA